MACCDRHDRGLQPGRSADGASRIARVCDRGGNAYVNVHEDDGVGDPNSGPGDFPGGEIRAQME